MTLAALSCAASSAPGEPPPSTRGTIVQPERGLSAPGREAAMAQAAPRAGRDDPAGPLAAALVRLAGLVGVTLSLAAIGIGLVLFARPQLETISDTATHSLARSLLVGLLGQVLIVPTLATMVAGLTLSVVGILLVPFVVIVYSLLVLAGIGGGFLGVAHALGEGHSRRQMARGVAISPNSLRYLLVGLGSCAAAWLGWALLGWVPVAGGLMLGAAGLVTWILATVGLGAFVLSRGGMRPAFAGRFVPPEMLTDEYLWATPLRGVAAVKRPGAGG
jgi:hypothetical protein